MKKFLILLLALTLVFALASCGECTEHVDADNDKKCDECGAEIPVKVISYEEFVAAELNTEVTVDTYVQAKQGWWEKDGVGVATFYTQNEEGAYFIYEMPCSKEDYNALAEGTKIRVTGYKSEWSGEVEITDATYKILPGNYVSTPMDATMLIGEETAADYQNRRIAFKDMTVVAANDSGAAFLYKWDGTGVEGDDIFFKVSNGKGVFTFVIESYFTGKDTDVYKAAQALEVGDIIDMEGFLYWYNGAQPHIYSIKQLELTDYESYVNAELNTEVLVETYVQAKQGWWEKDGVGVATFYTQNEEGAYFVYEMPCSKEDYDELIEGVMIRVRGYKSAWSGEIEITDASFKFLDGAYISTAFDVTELLGADNLIDYQNFRVSFSDMTVVESNENGDAFLYKWDGTGTDGDDLYFKASVGDAVYTFVIESYLTGAGTDVYEAVKNLSVGDVIDMEGFLYWYNGAQPHIISVVVK